MCLSLSKILVFSIDDWINELLYYTCGHVATQNVRYRINMTHSPLSFYVVYYDTVILPKSYSTNKQSSSNITKTSLKARVIFPELLE